MANVDSTQNAPLAAYQQYVESVMRERGFDDETVSQKFMLLLEEAGEFAQAARRDANLKTRADRRPDDTLADHAADVLTILLDLCNQLGIDLEDAFAQKEQKNKTRNWE